MIGEPNLLCHGKKELSLAIRLDADQIHDLRGFLLVSLVLSVCKLALRVH
jgi:hypothetical protein